MKPDTEEYFKRIQQIRESLPSQGQMKGKRSHFVKSPRTELVDVKMVRRHWIFWKKEKWIKGIKLITDMVYWSAELNDWVIELKGAVSDGASVPQVFWSLLPPFGKGKRRNYLRAAIGHDKYCRQGRKGISPIGFKKAALLFKEIMIVTDTLKRIYITMYHVVRWFGPRFDKRPPNPAPTN